MTSPTTLHRIVTIEDLELAGFTSVEIESLQVLKSRYPFIEFTDAPEQWQRLVFLKWRTDTGRLPHGVSAG